MIVKGFSKLQYHVTVRGEGQKKMTVIAAFPTEIQAAEYAETVASNLDCLLLIPELEIKGGGVDVSVMGGDGRPGDESFFGYHPSEGKQN